MPNVPMSADEKKWQAQDDAYTLARANVILADPERKDAAAAAAKQMAEKEKEDAQAMQRVANMGGKKGGLRAPAQPSTPTQAGSTNVGGEGVRGGGNFNVFKRI